MKEKSFMLLVLRVAIGLIFIYHGYPKLTSWPSLLGLPPWVGFAVGIVEVLFGIMLVGGIAFPWATIPLIIVIGTALVFVQIPGGIKASFERDFLIVLMLVYLMVNGPGMWAATRSKKKAKQPVSEEEQ